MDDASARVSGVLRELAKTCSSPQAAALLATLAVIALVTTRLTSARPTVRINGSWTVPMLPYWLPVLGHALEFFLYPASFLRQARDASPHGTFAINLGSTTHNIFSDPGLVKAALNQRESTLQFRGIEWIVMNRFFGIPNRLKARYMAIWDELNACITNTLMREPSISKILDPTIRGLEVNIPSMISFTDSPVDQQPWEQSGFVDLVPSSPSSEPVVEANLMGLMRDMMGYVSVPALFGRAFLENFPDVLQNLYAMDLGLNWFLMGVPRWLPIPPATRAHIARKKLLDSIAAFHVALDKALDGRGDAMWGDMDDVSETLLKRHDLFVRRGFVPEERGDIAILWAMTVNANLLVFWLILHILATPGLAARIREEVAPYVQVSEPVTIGSISSAPQLKIAHEMLSSNCPLLKSAYLEALRLSSQPWSIRKVTAAENVVISAEKKEGNSIPSYAVRPGEYVTLPHDLHQLDARCYEDPLVFRPERFIKEDEKGVVSVEMGSIKPFGGGPSICKGKIFAERECLSLVAGVLVCWDFEPVDPDGWKIPAQQKTTAVALPAKDVRVKIRRRKVEDRSS